jgi:hypothetical protein
MTINAVYSSGGTPILLSDYLATRDTRDGHIQIPTVEEIVLEGSVVALLRKARLVLPNFLIAGSGDGNAIETVFRRLINFATPTLTLTELQDYLDTQEDLNACTIVGHLIADGVHTFRWRSSDNTFETGEQFIEGSGRNLFADVLPHIDRGKAVEGYEFAVAREAAIQATTTLIGNEVCSANTIAEKFGGGYDIYVWDGDTFRLIDDIVYLIYRISFPNERDVRIYPAPFYVKIFAVGEYMAVMTFLSDTAIARLKGEPHQRISLIPPVPPSTAAVPDRQIEDIKLTAPTYGIGIIGPNINEKDEIFTAVVASGGYGAEMFNIRRTGLKKGDLHEIRFEIPETLMNNILQAAIKQLGREAWFNIEIAVPTAPNP